MNAENTKNLIVDMAQDFGETLIIVLGAVITIGLGMLIFREGFKLLKDQSYSIGGFYVRNLPYKGYNRWRSKKWNLENYQN